jgi:hypothetical protein
MSIKIMSLVWDTSPYEGKALLIHLSLADHANDEGICWPSQATLARKARCTERHVRSITRQMQADGWVEIVVESNGRDSHRYLLTIPAPRKSVPPRKSTTPSPEIHDTITGNPAPKNHQRTTREPPLTALRVGKP